MMDNGVLMDDIARPFGITVECDGKRSLTSICHMLRDCEGGTAPLDGTLRRAMSRAASVASFREGSPLSAQQALSQSLQSTHVKTELSASDPAMCMTRAADRMREVCAAHEGGPLLWVQALVWARKVAVQELRHLASLYSACQYHERYWVWARRHPYSLEMHTLFSCIVTTKLPIFAHRKAQCDVILRRLRRVEEQVVTAIGGIHSSLVMLNRGLAAIAHSGEDDTEEIGRLLTAVALRFVVGLQSVTFSCDAANNNSGVAPQAISMESASWTMMCTRITAHAASCLSMTAALREQVTTAARLPPGRQWRRVLSLSITLGLSWRFLRSFSAEKLSQHIFAFSDFASSFLENYVKIPAVAMIAALSAGRPGATERRDRLSAETALMNKVVNDFCDDHPPYEGEAAAFAAARHGNHTFINERYAEAIRHPIRSLFFGSLIRLLLIQVQAQQLEVTKVLIASDEVLESNDFNFKVMALMPMAMSLSLLLGYLALRQRERRQPICSRLKLCWRHLSRLVSRSEHYDHLVVGGETDSHSSKSELSHADQGRVLLTVHEMRSLCEGLGDYPLLPQLLQDLADVESIDGNRRFRMSVLDRMIHTHAILNPMFMKVV